jgi:hypothetical protein
MSGLLNILIGPFTELLKEIIPDKDQRERLAHELAVLAATQAHEAQQAQVEVNKQEAAHQSIFVAGWRPFVGWVCGAALAWNFVLYPVTQWVAFLYEVDLKGMPQLEAAELMTVLLGMLGLGGMRTYEKKIGVARSSLGKKLEE